MTSNRQSFCRFKMQIFINERFPCLLVLLSFLIVLVFCPQYHYLVSYVLLPLLGVICSLVYHSSFIVLTIALCYLFTCLFMRDCVHPLICRDFHVWVHSSGFEMFSVSAFLNTVFSVPIFTNGKTHILHFCCLPSLPTILHINLYNSSHLFMNFTSSWKLQGKIDWEYGASTVSYMNKAWILWPRP